ncbi:MAG: hypothetical protein EHM41_23990 [Chloroflexi bacterium]|nr:MAG: hypothetical protein EHM41_23990 [Chloroflexota bacterium]
MGGVSPLAFGLIGAANQPDQWAQILQQMFPGGPQEMMPQLAALTNQGQPDIGAMLAGTAPQAPNLGVVDPMNPDPAAAAAAPQVVPPPAAAPPPTMVPPPEAATVVPPPNSLAARTPVPPQVRAPEVQRPIMQAGVAGAQKPNELPNKGMGASEQQILMQLLMGGKQNPLRVPQLGALF